MDFYPLHSTAGYYDSQINGNKWMKYVARDRQVKI